MKAYTKAWREKIGQMKRPCQVCFEEHPVTQLWSISETDKRIACRECGISERAKGSGEK